MTLQDKSLTLKFENREEDYKKLDDVILTWLSKNNLSVRAHSDVIELKYRIKEILGRPIHFTAVLLAIIKAGENVCVTHSGMSMTADQEMVKNKVNVLVPYDIRADDLREKSEEDFGISLRTTQMKESRKQSLWEEE